MASTCDQRPLGNHLPSFSTVAYLHKAAARRGFRGRFVDSMDPPDTRLIGAFIATLGLPPVSPLQDQFRERLDAMFGADHGYADLVPGLQKVVQAAGRVLRSADDKGYVWLLDQRFRRPDVRALLPAWWQI